MARYARHLADEVKGYASPYGVRVPFDKKLMSFRIRKLISRWEYEREEAFFALKNLRPDTRILELGGGIGFVSARIQQWGERVHVTSFEPNPRAGAHYRKVMDANGLANFSLHSAVLGDKGKSEKVEFAIHREFWASSTSGESRHGTALEVEVVDQRSWLANNRYDMLIIDIEGDEAGFVELLEAPVFRVIVMELHTDVLGFKTVDALLGTLRRLGYDLTNGFWETPPHVCVFKRRSEVAQWV